MTSVTRNTLTASFMVSAAGTAPHTVVDEQSRSRMGRTRATASGSPASMPTSSRRLAGSRDPETGAST
ncbi:MAG TPA: hypothetical protein VHB92_01350 [Humibacter sp.]|nr:hypothetical protein [Humibacter sp.]HVX06562.1 hypothetical protein [Humibacter sp.]